MTTDHGGDSHEADQPLEDAQAAYDDGETTVTRTTRAATIALTALHWALWTIIALAAVATIIVLIKFLQLMVTTGAPPTP